MFDIGFCSSGEENRGNFGAGVEVFAERCRCETVAFRDSLVAFSGGHGKLAS